MNVIDTYTPSVAARCHRNEARSTMACEFRSRRVALMLLVGTCLASMAPNSSFAGELLTDTSSPPNWPRNVVRVLQLRLRELTFDPGPIDGIYGPLTAKAIARFQLHNGLTIDGRISHQLLDALGIY